MICLKHYDRITLLILDVVSWLKNFYGKFLIKPRNLGGGFLNKVSGIKRVAIVE